MITQPMRFLQRENVRLQEENEQLREEVRVLRQYVAALRALQQAAQGITSEEDAVVMLKKTLRAALDVVDAADGSLLLVDPDTDELMFAVVLGSAPPDLIGYRLKPGVGLAGWVAAHRQPLMTNSPRFDARFSSLVDDSFDFQTQSLVAVPLLGRERVIGVIEVLNKFNGQEFTEADLDLLTLLAHIAASALEKLEEKEEREEREKMEAAEADGPA